MSAEDRLSLLIDRLLASMDAAASTGAWDRVVELADDVLAVDPPNQRATSMIERATLERSLPGGQRAFVSLVFADIVQSTDMADVAEPEVIQDVFVLYRRVAAETIEELGGRVLQFQGDGVVACFGYPTAHEDDARRAVMAALRLVERMADAAIELHRRHGIEPAIRVGVHSGTVVVAGLASGVLDGSALAGSVPNVAARLQGEAEPGTVVISDTTRQLVEPHFELKPIGTRSLKGIARPMELHHVVRSNLAVPPPGRGLPESVALIGREGQSRLLRFTWKRLVHDTEGAHAARGDGGRRPWSGRHREVGAGRRARGARAPRGRRRARGQLFALSRQRRAVARRAHARATPRVLSRPAAGGAARELEARLEDAGLERDTVPLLAPLLGLDIDERWSRPEVDALALRQQTLQALVAWLAHTAASTPTLVLVEDLHWADPTTVDLLGLLATESVPGVMILITSRLPLDAPWASSVVDIELEPLQEKEAAGLVAALTDGGLDPAAVSPDRRARSRCPPLPAGADPQRRHRPSRRGPSAPDPRDPHGAPSGSRHRPARGAAGGHARRGVRRGAAAPAGRAVGRRGAGRAWRTPRSLSRSPRSGSGRYRFRHGLLRDAAYETQVLPARQADPSQHRGAARLRCGLARRPGRRGPALGPGRRRRASRSRPTSWRPRRRSRRPATPRPASCSTAPWSWRRRCPRATSAT